MSGPSTVANSSQTLPEQQAHAPHAEGSAATTRGVDAPQIPSPGQPFRSIPPGAVVIRHEGNTTSLIRRRKRPRPGNGSDDGIPDPISMAPPQMPTADAMPKTFSTPHIPVEIDTELPAHTAKKARGRPHGSLHKNQPKESSGSTAAKFNSFILNVKEGEEIYAKIMNISQTGPGGLCVLSANGAISIAKLNLLASPDRITYEGWFDIVSLSGSFILSEPTTQKSGTGCMSITLARPDGQIFGGSVAGSLIAASPVRVMVGSFAPDGYKGAKSDVSAPLQVNPGGASGATNCSSMESLSESRCGGLTSPINLNSGACSSTPQGMPHENK